MMTLKSHEAVELMQRLYSSFLFSAKEYWNGLINYDLLWYD